MSSLELSPIEAQLLEVSDTLTVLTARGLFASRRVTLDLEATGASPRPFDGTDGLIAVRVGGTSSRALVVGDMVRGVCVGVRCSCEAPGTCVHVAATLIALDDDGWALDVALERAPGAVAATAPTPITPGSRPRPSPASGSPSGPVPAWRRALDAAFAEDGEAPASRPAAPAGRKAKPPHPDTGAIGLAVTWLQAPPRRDAAPTVELRPVLRSHTGNWIKTGGGWHEIGYQDQPWQSKAPVTPRRKRQVALLRELRALHRSGETYSYYGSRYDEKVAFDGFATASVWRLLRELVDAGVPLIQPGKGEGVVVLHDQARLDVVLDRGAGGALGLHPRFTLDGERFAYDELLLLGRSPHGLGWRLAHRGGGASGSDLHLAPLDPDGLDDVLRAMRLPSIEVPPEEEAAFVDQYLPQLTERFGVVVSDPTIAMPAVSTPRLEAAVGMVGDHRATVQFTWTYRVGDAVRRLPHDADMRWRDREAEDAVLARLSASLEAGFPEELVSIHPHARTVPTADGTGTRRVFPRDVETLGLATARLVTQVLPVWEADPDIDVVVDDSPGVAYRFAGSATVTFEGLDTQNRDWFDLGVTVAVPAAREGDPPEQVPFSLLFSALVRGDAQLLLPTGTVLDLRAPALVQLRELIEESRELHDTRGPLVRASRLQGGLFEELEASGFLDEQARAWQSSLVAADTADVGPFPVPAGVKATLRPYQEQGLDWLVRLYRLRLGGGILADDMGLGKTLQALALVCHVREHGLSDAPFLVVAPASVTHGWAREASLLTPGLRVVVVGQTSKKSGVPLAELVAGADVVVTSYTLFRIDADSYEGLSWAGLVLDEAQFAKNHTSHAYRGAKRLPAPFKLAVTGTPMENHRGELWALLSITVPGLFPRMDRFAEHYRKPIEKAADTRRLQRLRRRIGPLMLRRTKAEVLTELPDKQEQVLEVELNPAHRRVYQQYLQRERKKVLGLIEDLDANRIEVLRSLTLLRQAAIDVALLDEAHAGVPSTKLEAVAELLDDAVAEGHSVLVFSQFTRFLARVRDHLDAAGVPVAYLDGRTRDRGAVIESFRRGEAPVFLISLKAGGFGLNLTEADYCVLLDPWWNPAAEQQAVDRAHRMGQQRKVMVYRLVSKDTIEDKVMALKAEKAALFAGVMSGAEFSAPVLDADAVRGLLSE
ncbi:MAG: DEAD/DEAH box helicase [Kineosporiaceae bacterium]